MKEQNKKDSAKVTISNRRGHDSGSVIAITITDDSSGLQIVEVEMSPENFVECLTGLAYAPATFLSLIDKKIYENVGRKRETKTIFVDKPSLYADAESRKKEVLKSVEGSGELRDGWMLHSDGIGTQQPTDRHAVVLYRFVEKK